MVTRIRQWFCKHDLERIEEAEFCKSTEFERSSPKKVVVYMCRKCGFTRKIILSDSTFGS